MANATNLTHEQQALLALRTLRRRVEELEQAQREPIAIVGMGCRIPGGVHDPESFWKLLLEKRNAVTEIPRERIDLQDLFDPTAHTPGKTYSKWAGLLTDPGDFDAEFFGISPREALSTDPQQRLLLESSWEALEDAGIDPRSLAGQDAGVFIGISMTEYAQHYQNCVPKEGLAAHFLQGSALNAANGRLSYFYGLQGPSMAIDTACSSSLVAIDRACRSLRQGETGMAIAGGVHLLATSLVLITASQWGMLSPRGACRAFDEEADGFVRAEGCGVLILKRLRDAEKDGDRILGLILGSAVNQDGASSGLTVPNGVAQQELVRRALTNAGIEPRQVSYVEAHGTGTALGDPIEAQALGAVFNDGKQRESPVLLGSVKTNIGHLESAAGVAGLIKVLLALRHKQIPAQLYGEKPTSRAPWRDLPLEVSTEARPWEPIEGRRIAGISSFGFSGTNAHAIVEGIEDRRAAETRTRPAEVLPMSARTPTALRELVNRYADFLEQTDASWGEICHSAGTGRAVFAERLAIVAGDKKSAAIQLREWLQNGASTHVHQGAVRPGERLRAALILGLDLEGTDLEGLDHLFGDAFATDGERAKTWESRWRSWGVDPMLVASPGPDLEAQLERASVTLAVVTGAVALDWPAVQLAPGSGWRDLAHAVAALFVRGVRIDWKSWEGDLKHRSVMLPTYPFQRQRFWIEAQQAKPQAQGETTGRPLLGRRLRAAGVRGQFETELLLDGALSWIGEHVVEGRPVFPGTAHIELMLEAGADALGAHTLALEDLILQAPLAIDAPRSVQTVVESESGGRSRVRIYAENDTGKWETMSEAWIGTPTHKSLEADRIDLAEIRSRLRSADVAQFYTGMAERGLQFGDAFRGLTALWTGENESLGEIHDAADETGYDFAPWRLDACGQAAAALVGDAGLYLPLSAKEFVLYGSPAGTCWSHARLQQIDSDGMIADIAIYDADGGLLARFRNLRLRKRAAHESRVHESTTGIYGIDWTPAELSHSPTVLQGHWLIFGDDPVLDEEIAQSIRGQGGSSRVVRFPKIATSDGGEPELAEILRKVVAHSGSVAGVLSTRQSPSLSEDLRDGLGQFQGYAHALSLLQTLVREQISPASGVWFVTRNAQAAVDAAHGVSVEGRAIWALRRTAAMEFPELPTHAVDLDLAGSAEELLRVVAGTREAEIAWRSGSAWKPRLAKRMPAGAETMDEDNTEIRPSPKGTIDDLLSAPVPRAEPQNDEIEIKVRAHGVNFRDVMNTLGMLPGFPPHLGGECAGVVARAGERSGYRVGDRVFAFALGSFRTFVTVPARNATRIPARMTFAQAATLPVAYLTAFLGLDRLAKLRAGERILIHSATGGLGLAAVHLALARGAVVFATAGSEEKRAYLGSLGVRHVFSSRTVDFAAGVMQATGGAGVDVVLNSLTGALAESTLSTLARSGRFLEVGKRNVLTEEQVHRVRPDVEYYKFDLGEEAERDSTLTPALLVQLLEMLAAGQIPALPVKEFENPGDALRFMAQARHIGKIAITRAEAHEAQAIESHATYLITGGTGGVGLHFAEWLVNRGAMHLVLASRGGGDAASRSAIDRLRATGAEIHIACMDVADATALRALLDSIPHDRPLRGVIHAAGVLDDRSLLRQNFASFVTVAQPKWTGAWNLHQMTRTQPLDFFVLFSSAAASIGMAGQANYSAANAMLDGLASYRRSLGLPALSIAWGPWAGSGMAVDLKPASLGLGWITAKDGTEALDALLTRSEPTAHVLPVASWRRFIELRPSGASSLFASLNDEPKDSPITGRETVAPQAIQPEHRAGFVDRLQQADPEERSAILAEHLRQQTVQILSLARDSKVDEDAALHDLGVDSLMAVELRNALQVSLNQRLSPTLALDYPTLRALREHLLNEMFGLEDQSAVSALIDNIEDLSESEAEALLLAELEGPVHGAER